MLVIVMTVKEWRHYLDAPAHRTIVLNQALQSFMTTKQLQGNQTRTATTGQSRASNGSV